MGTWNARPVVLAKKTTREVVKRYPSASAASLAERVREGKIAHECKNRWLGEGNLYWRYEDDFDPDESFENRTRRRPVLAINEETGHWLWFESITAAGMHFYGYDEGAVRAMKSGKPIDGYVFVYADKRMRSERCEVKA